MIELNAVAVVSVMRFLQEQQVRKTASLLTSPILLSYSSLSGFFNISGLVIFPSVVGCQFNCRLVGSTERSGPLEVSDDDVAESVRLPVLQLID